MLLSEKLRKVSFTEIDDPVEYFDQLASEATEMEAIISVHSILVEQLGQNVVEDTIKNYLQDK